MNMMFARLTKSNIDRTNMTTFFYDKNQTPIKTVHFGAARYADKTVAPHDKYKEARSIKIHKERENWNDHMSASAVSTYMCGNTYANTAINTNYKKYTIKQILNSSL